MTNDNLLELAVAAALDAGNKTLKFYHQKLDVVVKEDNSPLTQADLESNSAIIKHLEKTGLPILSEENKVVSYSERSGWNRFWLIDPLDGTKEFINKRSEYTINIALVEKGTPIAGVVFAPVLGILYFATKKTGSYKARVGDDRSFQSIQESAIKLEVKSLPEKLRIVASRSHLSEETKEFIDSLKQYYPIEGQKSYGSSLKLCMVAEGEADIYPRLGPTMEWDTAASHAVAIYAGSKIIETEKAGSLHYNKENLLNPYFVVYNPVLEKTVLEILNKG